MPTAEGQLTAAELAQLLALVQAQAAIRQQLTQIAVAGALAPLRILRSWWDTTEVTLAALQILRVLQPAQLRMAQVTDAYLARALSIMTGQSVRPIGAVDVRQLRRLLTPGIAPLVDRPPVLIRPAGDLNLDRVFDDPDGDDDDYGWPDDHEDLELDGDRTDTDLRPADMVEVYSRVAAQYRYHVTQGMAEAAAEQRALERAETMARTDLLLAMRAQSREVLVRRTNATGYRRVLHPELSQTGTSCGLCIVAADRVYRKEHLLPIHDNCNCEVMPIENGIDPGLRLNQDDLDRLYTAAGSTGGGKRERGALKYVRAVITEHGELGQILAEAPKNPRGSRRGPNKVAASTRRQFRTLPPEERIEGLLKSTAELQRRLAAGERRLAPAIDYQRRLIEQLRQELAAVS